MGTIKLTNDSVEYVLKQRTLIQASILERVEREFSEHINKDYNLIKPYLPLRPNGCVNILDIGCGIGGIDVLLNQHYDFNTNLYLLDKTETCEKPFYSYRPVAAFYNSLKVTKQIMKVNGVGNFQVEEVSEETLDKYGDDFMDLILSLYSWGFHYPLPIYIEQVKRTLKPGGVLVLDVSLLSNGLDLLRENFESIKIMDTTSTCNRVVCFGRTK